jgi:hypothetical protein
MKRSFVFVILVTLVLSVSALAQGKPDFSGTWTLDTAKSDMGQARSGTSGASMQKVTLIIQQTPSLFSTTRKVGERSETATEKLDGSESVNKSPSGHDIKSTSKWVGSTLVTNSTMLTEAGKTESTFIRSLSADGRVLTIDTTIKAPNSNVEKTKLLYNKQ